VPVQPPAVRGQEHRPAGAVADGQVDSPRRARRDGDDLAALTGNRQGPVPALQAAVPGQLLSPARTSTMRALSPLTR
jgi:hypothetical protein